MSAPSVFQVLPLPEVYHTLSSLGISVGKYFRDRQIFIIIFNLLCQEKILHYSGIFVVE
ncbi:MAG: hypothetical protein SAL07_02305 [Oscillatoria sp. PMC 1051.18]|nr:hypothetical protein [Oscillatoria sp. PMC 1050.18]MEC5028719.1 hypothetical protein [Oscillatoria sp. PMC 1051.18]